MTQEQVSTRGDALGDALDAGLRLFSSEVHENVAAEYRRGLRDHRLSISMREVVVRDAHVAPKRRHDLKPAALLPQILLATRNRQPLDLVLGVFGLLRSGESVKGDIGGNDVPVAATDLVEEHREAVRLLAVPATCAPDRVRGAIRSARELGECDELRRVPEEAAVLNGDPVEQLIKCSRLGVDHVHVRMHGNAGEARAFLKQSLEACAAGRLSFQAGARLDHHRSAVEGAHAHRAFARWAGRSAFIQTGVVESLDRCGAGNSRPRSRETALSRPASSKEVLTM